MYDKNTDTNTHKHVGKKQAYKCMKKTGIQMYDKNAYKIAYKCMTKTHIQTRIQMYEKNRHTNV